MASGKHEARIGLTRLDRWVMLASLLPGLLAVAAVWRAFDEYRDVTRAYSAVEAQYVPDTFVWLDPDFASGEVELRIVNQSPRHVTVEHLDLHLYFDGRFAGSDYAVWQPLGIDEGSEQRVTVKLEVSISDLRSEAAEALITLHGQMRLRFEDVKRPLTIRFDAPVGHLGAE